MRGNQYNKTTQEFNNLVQQQEHDLTFIALRVEKNLGPVNAKRTDNQIINFDKLKVKKHSGTKLGGPTLGYLLAVCSELQCSAFWLHKISGYYILCKRTGSINYGAKIIIPKDLAFRGRWPNQRIKYFPVDQHFTGWSVSRSLGIISIPQPYSWYLFY